MQKTVLITGANGNAGTAVVKTFLEKKFRVIAVDGKNDQLGFAIDNPLFEWHAVNVADEQETNTFLDGMIKKFHRIDAAVLLVGGFDMGNLEKTELSQIRKMTTLNFDTAFNCSRILFSHMLQQGAGRIVFTGARPALQASQGKNMVAYALSKSLLFTLASIMNAEAKGKNVTASVIVPSTIDTPANRASMPDANASAWVTPEEVAATIEFICSEDASPLREMVYKIYKNA